jgi:hypothetical protein
MKTKAVVVVLLLLFPIVISSAYAEVKENVKIELYAPKVSLPADGEEYKVLAVQLKKDNKPLIANSDVEIELSSTNEDVLIVQKRAVIKAGSSYVMAKIITTKTEGKATIIAHSKYYGEASIEVSTAKVKLEPTSIVAYAIPPTLRASPDSKAKIVVQLIDKFGRPALSDREVILSFKLSKEKLGSIVRSVVIERGKNKAEVEFKASYFSGEVVVIVEAEGIGSDSVTIKTYEVVGKILKVYVAPSRIPADGKSKGIVMVQLQDERGNPAPAPKDIEVIVTSSNISVAKVSDKLKIKQGQDYAVGWYEVTNIPGKTTITVSASDYSPSSEELFTVKEGGNPVSLIMQVIPNVREGEGIRGFTVVQVQDKEGLPTNVKEDVEVFICSANSTVAEICTSVVIEKGSSYSTAKFYSTSSGNTTITASAQGLIAIRKPVKVFGTKPSKIGLFGTTKVLGSEKEFGPFMIVLLDDNGVPTKAKESVEIILESSNSSIVSVNRYVVIPKGKEFVEFNVKLSGLNGNVNLTANSKFGSAKLQITVSSKKPDKVFVQLIPNSFIADGKEHSSIFIELLDSLGFPAEALDNTPVYLASSNFSIAEVKKQIVIEKYGIVKYGIVKVGKTSGNASIVVSSPNLMPSEAKLQTFTLTMLGKLVAKPEKIRLNDKSNVTLQLTYDDNPIANAKIKWDVKNAEVVRMQNVTNKDGYASIIILGKKIGNATIVVNVEKDGYTPITLSSNVTILPLPLKVSISIATRPIYANKSVVVKVVVRSDDKPINDAQVKFSASVGKIMPSMSKTNPSGEAIAQFISPKIGNVKITAIASKENYETKSNSIEIAVIKSIVGVEGGVGGIEQGIVRWIMENLILVIAGIALPVGAAVGLIIIRRRRRMALE